MNFCTRLIIAVFEIELSHSLEINDKNSGSESSLMALPVTISFNFEMDVVISPKYPE